jgi:hypothetical protein
MASMSTDRAGSDPFGKVLLEELAALRRRRAVIFEATRAEAAEEREEGTRWDAARFAAEGGAAAQQARDEELARLEEEAFGLFRDGLAGDAVRRRLVEDYETRHGSPPDAAGLEALLRAELAADQDMHLAASRRLAQEEHLAGLAFSGGGIRSGTFAVGVLQGLSSLKLLRWFDVLSTVSGGGYAGGWLTAWMAREGDPLNVERQLGTSRIAQADAARPPLPRGQVVEEEPEPLRHLRQYSSFLNPRPGWFSIDTWTVLAIYLRNLTINALLVLPALLLIAILSRGFVWGYAWLLRARGGMLGPIIAGSPRFYDDPVGYLGALADGRPVPIVTLLFGLGALLVLAGFAFNSVGLERVRADAPGSRRRGPVFLRRAVLAPILTGTVILAGALPAALDLLREDVVVALQKGRRIDAAADGARRAARDAGATPAQAEDRADAAREALGGTGPRNLGWFGSIANAARRRGWGLDGDGQVAGADYLSLPSVLVQALFCSVLIALPPLLRLLRFAWRAVAPTPGGEPAAEADAATAGGGRPGGPPAGGGEVPSRFATHLRELGAAILAGIAGGVALAVGETLLRPTFGQPWLLLAVGPPTLLLVVSMAITALVAVRSTFATELEREWWGSLSARFLWIGAGWMALILTLGYGPALLMGAGAGARAALATGWLGLTAVGGRLGYLASLKRVGGRSTGLLLAVAPVVFLAGLLAAASLAATAILNGLPGTGGMGFAPAARAYLVRSLEPGPGGTYGAMVGGAVLKAAVLAGLLYAGFRAVNVNLFSLNAFYANRLARCFLGASRSRAEWAGRWDEHRRCRLAGAPTGAAPLHRDADRVTGFDARDDLPLADLAIGNEAVPTTAPGGPRCYWGPHHLVNTALSLIAGDELAWRDRKAASFVLTPLACGSQVTGYAASGATRPNLSLGRAVSISGAAVDPSMSIYQSSGLTALLVVLNVRLGHWLENPVRRAGATPWTAREPRAGVLLVNEITGHTTAREEHVRLTDGGHFENLGVYELLRRRCRYIVAVDATENPNATSDNLGILVRLARVDFGIRIQLDTSPLAVTAPDGLSRAHVAIGRIRYDDVDNGQMPGILVYVRSSMTGDEPPDVQQYANTHPEFPREGTLDQSFDESQFESYRALGEHVAQAVFENAARELEGAIDDAQDARDASIRVHRRVFSALRNLWSNPPLDQDERAMQATRAWVTLQRDLRTDRKLSDLSGDLYPELGRLAAAQGQPWRHRAEVHALEQMLQTMEDAWLGLGMKGYPDLPMNRGWMNTLRRLAASATFRRFWPVLRTQYSPEFVRFCEEQLRLQAGPPRLAPVAPDDAAALALLGAEFAREWPREVGRGADETLDEAGRRYLGVRVARATPLPAGTGGLAAIPAAWLILQGPIEHDPGREPGLEFPLGLLAVTPTLKAAGAPDPDADADYELFLWIRRAHRSARAGDAALRGLMEQLEGRLGGAGATFRTRVRFPGDRLVNLDRDRDLWATFFSTFDFRIAPGRRSRGDREGSRILYRTLHWPARPAAGTAPAGGPPTLPG